MCYRRCSLTRWDRATCGTKFGAIILSVTEQNLLTADWRSICTSMGVLQILQQHRPAEPFCWATNIISRQCNRGVDLGFQCFSHEGRWRPRRTVESEVTDSNQPGSIDRHKSHHDSTRKRVFNATSDWVDVVGKVTLPLGPVSLQEVRVTRVDCIDLGHA